MLFQKKLRMKPLLNQSVKHLPLNVRQPRDRKNFHEQKPDPLPDRKAMDDVVRNELF